MEKKLAESTTKSIPSFPSGASVGNHDLGDAALGPSSEVDAQSSEPIHQTICKENDQTTCSIFDIDSSDEASARNMKAEKRNEEVSDTTSIDANGKSLSADTTDSCFLEPAAQSEVEEIDKTKVSVCVSATCASAKSAINFFSDTTSGLICRWLHVVALKQTSDVKHLGDLNVSVEEGNLDASPIGDRVYDNHGAEVSSSRPAIDSSGETSSKQTFDVKRLGNSIFSVEEGNLDASPICDGVDVNNDTEVSSSTPAIDSSVEASLKQTSDVEWLGGSNVSVEGGNLDASPIGGVNNGAEVSSSRPVIDSSVETSLNAALVNNTDCQLDLSPGSQACGSSLNSSDASAEAKASFNEKIVHSEPSQAESHEVTVVSSCSGTVHSSANVSYAQRAAEETAVGSQAESHEVTVLGSCSGTIHSSDDVSPQHAGEEKIQTQV
uniref:Orf protein n=1 Tax=Nicotiana tabacum TaxID=4097 RepID=Q40576_TOBAC|nr:orf [Nicotiana tabacum]